MFDFSALQAGEPIPAVSSGDLRGVWDLTHEAGADLVGSRKADVGIGYDVAVLAQACGPGADVIAVWARSALLDVLVRQGLLTPWLRGTQLDDAVFDVAASCPIPGFDRFDPDAFLERLGRPTE
jgi:hypothetical protein